MIRFWILTLLIILTPFTATAQMAADEKAATILSYHRIDDPLATDSLSRAQFETHLEMIASERVLSLPYILEAFEKQDNLPPGALTLTFDHPTPYIYNEIFPLLLKRNLPFTIFIDPAQHHDGLNRYVRESLVTIGLSVGLNRPNAQARLNSALAGFRELTGRQPKMFAHQAGLYDASSLNLLENAAFDTALGQQSGVAYENSDKMALPRFTMTAQHGNTQRFEMILNALPLPHTDMQPTTSLIETNRPAIGMTLTSPIENIECFVSGQDEPKILFPSEQRLEIRLAEPIMDRTRVNCIAPAGEDWDTGQTRWRWAGFLFEIKDQN